jgi:hypothetical protein
MDETDLYRPVHDYLAEQGYAVQGEVRKCDVAAVKGDELVIVELKLRLNAEVLAQAAQRQQITDSVYVAIPRPKAIRSWRTRSRGMLYLLKRLELGLMLVAPKARKRPKVEIEHPIQLFDRVKTGKLRGAIVREVRRRSGDFNEGGSVRRKVIGAFKETAIHIACCLERFGPATARELRRLGTGPTTWSVLAKSAEIEGWFERRPDGAYALKRKGKAALEEYAEAAEHYRAELKTQNGTP